MDGHSLGKAMAGVAYLAMFGMACAVALYIFAPGFIFIGALQVGSRLAVGAWYPVQHFWTFYGFLTTLWISGNLILWWFFWWEERQTRARLDAQHKDFMRLRKLFYRDNEVCLDSYETLKRRAGEA